MVPFLNFPFELFLRNGFPNVVFCRFTALAALALLFRLYPRRLLILANSLSIFNRLIEKSCRIQENGYHHHLNSILFQQCEQADGQTDVSQGVDALCGFVQGI